MGLLGAVFQHGLALGHDGGEHGVHGRAHADLVKKDPRALQLFFGADGDHAVIHAVLGAQSAERLQVLVDGAGPQVAAAGHGHLRPAEPGQQRAQEIIAGPHLPGQVVRHIGAHQMGGVDLVGVAVQHPHLGAQGAEDVQADGHVADVGQILDHTDTGGQDGGGQDAHRRVLRARNIDLAHQRPAACNNKLLQSNDLLHGVRKKNPAPPRGLHGPAINPPWQAGFWGGSCVPPPIAATLLYTTCKKKQSFRPGVCSYFLFCPDSPNTFVYFLPFIQNIPRSVRRPAGKGGSARAAERPPFRGGPFLWGPGPPLTRPGPGFRPP